MRSDMAKLVNGHQARQYNVVAYGNVTGQCATVREYAIIADDAIVGDVAICLDQAVFPDDGFPPVFCAAVYRHAFPNRGVIANFRSGLFALKLQILRDPRNNSPWEYTAVFTDARAIHNGHVGTNPCTVFDDDVLVDRHKRFDYHIARNFGLWVNIGKWLYHAWISFTFTICALSSASTTIRSEERRVG